MNRSSLIAAARKAGELWRGSAELPAFIPLTREHIALGTTATVQDAFPLAN